MPATCATRRRSPRGADFIARFGAPDIVIANAGVSRGTLTERAEDLPAFRAVFETNVLGMVHTFQPFIGADARGAQRRARRHRERRRLSRHCRARARTAASKAAAIAYLESLRVELRGSGVAVVTVCPGYIATPMTAQQSVPHAVPARRRTTPRG